MILVVDFEKVKLASSMDNIYDRMFVPLIMATLVNCVDKDDMYLTETLTVLLSSSLSSMI